MVYDFRRVGQRAGFGEDFGHQSAHILRQLLKHKALTVEQAAPGLRQAHIERMK